MPPTRPNWPALRLISVSSSFGFRRWPAIATTRAPPPAALEKAGKDGNVRVHARDLGYLYVALDARTTRLNPSRGPWTARSDSQWLTVAPRVDPLRSEPRFQPSSEDRLRLSGGSFRSFCAQRLLDPL